MGAPHALIAGAGIGGLCAALCLARSGWRVSIFEAAATLEEVGAGLQLSPNASAILRRLGVLARLKPASLAPESIRIRRARDGATLVLMRLNDPEKRWGAPYLLAHRADLQRALLEAVADQPDIVLEAGTALERFASGPDNVVAVLRRGPNAAEIAGDCLIGADGWRSIVRAGLFGPSHRVDFARRTAWRALVPAQSVAPEMLRPQCSLWLGHRAHLVHYPLRAGAVVNVVAVIGDDAPFAADDAAWSGDCDPSPLLARFAGWQGDARALLAAAGSWRRWPLIHSDPLPAWTAGRVALLGDAAHPMLPFMAQGAAQAIEDADALGGALQGVAPQAADLARALKIYAGIRRPRASRVQRQSHLQGQIYHLSGVAALARDAAMRTLGGDGMLSRYDWVYAVPNAER